MSDAHLNQMYILVGFIGFLLLAIIATIAFSQLKKNKTKTVANADKPVLDKPATPLKTSSAEEPVLVKTTISTVETKVEESTEVEPDLKSALKKTEESFFGRIRKAFSNQDRKQVLEEIEEVLYTSDLGPSTVQKLMAVVESELSSSQMGNIDSVKKALAGAMTQILAPIQQSVNQSGLQVEELIKKNNSQGPTVLMVVGVNGAGKTTSIGKISAQLASQGKKVLVAAGDTFRAAAGGQLKTWTDRAQVEIYWPTNTTDPSAVAFDAVSKANSQGYDYVILDTAGRLHTQGHLMEELKKVKRVIAKVLPDAPHEIWIVLDANSGQNALIQAKEFNQAVQLTGVVLTKMDGTAKGGVALGVVDQLQLPIKLVGIGEKINHLKSFKHEEYIASILGS